MLCSICFNEIPNINGWDSGNNASPVNTGRCCNNCDNAVVIPARLNMMSNNVSTETFMAMQREQVRDMLTAAEREAVERAVGFCECTTSPLPTSQQIVTLQRLLERTK